MSWTKIVSLLALAAPALAGAQMVVRATGPSAAAYPPGKKLGPAARLRLRVGDQVTLLDAKGTRTLRGPGEFGVNAPSSPAPSALASLRQNTDRRVRVGAVRSVPGASAARPSLWMVDVAKPGPVCLPAATGVLMWRGDPTAAATGAVARAGAAPVPVAWAAGQSSQPWPAAAPLADGATYRVSIGAQPPVDVTARLVGAPSTDLEAAAAKLIAAGCAAQLDQLIEATAVKG